MTIQSVDILLSIGSVTSVGSVGSVGSVHFLVILTFSGKSTINLFGKPSKRDTKRNGTCSHHRPCQMPIEYLPLNANGKDTAKQARGKCPDGAANAQCYAIHGAQGCRVRDDIVYSQLGGGWSND
jgi:hypothetical protein